MRGFKLGTDHDLSLDAGGRAEYVDGDEATAQEIGTRLLFLRGENFLDVREGVPYLTEILIKGVNEARIKSLIRNAILSVPAVVDVPTIELSLDRPTRVATVTWTARTIEGRTIHSADFPPLILP